MIKVIYVGKDITYFEDMKKRFREGSDEEFEFKTLWHEDSDNFQRLSSEIVRELPNIAFLDYSSNPLKMMTVARSLPRLFDRGPSLIGLWDYQADLGHLKESQTLGIPFTHFKSPEYSDIIAQSLFLLKGGIFPEGEFAKAEVMKVPLQVTAKSLFRIGYLTETYVHVEHDFMPPNKEELLLDHHFEDSFPIDYFRLERRLDFNYYYEAAYVSDLSFVFLDAKEKAEQLKKNTNDQKKKAFWQEHGQRESMDSKKKKIKAYIEKHENGGGAKRTRLMVIDQEMNILDQAIKPIDSYPYSIRFYRTLKNRDNLINRVRPGILCYQCPEKSEGELGEIMQQTEDISNFNPFIVIFQSAWTSEHLQKHYNYSRIIAWDEKFSFDQLLTFCETYENKYGREKSHDMSHSFHSKEKRFYIQKDSPESFMEYPFPIQFKAICETWVKFQSEQEVALWSILSVEKPVPFNLTVIEALDEKDWANPGCFQYRGVVHGLGERERSNMRVAINQLIHKEIKFEENLEKKVEEKSKKSSDDSSVAKDTSKEEEDT